MIRVSRSPYPVNSSQNLGALCAPFLPPIPNSLSEEETEEASDAPAATEEKRNLDNLLLPLTFGAAFFKPGGRPKKSGRCRSTDKTPEVAVAIR